MATEGRQAAIDDANARFWDEPCGTAWARNLGIGTAAEDLEAFDRRYLGQYPYLPGFLPTGGRVLEIGLGSGTVSQLLAERGCDLHGLDIAAGPVETVRDRLRALGVEEPRARVVQGSALAIPHPDASFDHVVSIGCLHHTGDLPGAVQEVRRVLRPGGTAHVMVYNRASWRQLVTLPRRRLLARLRGRPLDGDHQARAAYDVNQAGEAAPATTFTAPWEVTRLFAGFSDVRTEQRNAEAMVVVPGLVRIPRERLLPTLGRVAGLDLYVTARR